MPKINFGQEQTLEAFVYQMVIDKGLLEEDKKQNGKIQHELRVRLDETIQMAIIDALPEPRLKELDQALNSGATDRQIEQFFQNAGVNYTKVAADAMAKFRQNYLSGQVAVPATQATPSNASPDIQPNIGMNQTVAINNVQPNMTAVQPTAPTTQPNQSTTSTTNDNLLNNQAAPMNNTDMTGEINR